MVKTRIATNDDVEAIQKIADKVWWPTYINIIGEEQIKYMLDLFYSSAVVAEQIKDNIQTYLLLEEDNIPIAFAAFSPRTEDADIYKLHKLYCDIDKHGKGYGRVLLQATEKEVIKNGGKRLELNVNRYNPAKTFYEKNGYTIAYKEDIDIGGGFWMNDYVMGKDLTTD